LKYTALIRTAAVIGLAVSFYAFTVMAKDTDEPIFRLYDPGSVQAVKYEEYGIVSGAGTYGYKYTITDPLGLAAASGEGIDPNTAVEKDPAYKSLKGSGMLKGSHWKHVNTGDPQADFFAWATAYKENPGTRLFFTARALKEGRLYVHAI
jgi:hypothetical protein